MSSSTAVFSHGCFCVGDARSAPPPFPFKVPGTADQLKGIYRLYSEQIDLHGVARPQAGVADRDQLEDDRLKPVDPFLMGVREHEHSKSHRQQR
jgi:hypothetical protein